MLKFFFGIALALVAALPATIGSAAAQTGANQRHAGTGITIPPALGGMPFASVQNENRGLDVIVHYYTPDRREVLTLYLYKPAFPGAGLWFDQARSALQRNPALGNTTGATTQRFSTPGTASPDGLAVAYRTRGAQMRSTALALVQRGEWLVKLRMSSATLDEAAIAARIVEAARALPWPREASGAARIESVPQCSDRRLPTRGGTAEPATAALAERASSGLPATLAADRRRQLCRENQQGAIGVYRFSDGTPGYLLGLGDAGQVARVRPLDPSAAGGLYVVEFVDLGSASVAAFFRGVPSLDQAVEATGAAMSGRAVVRIDLETGEAQRLPI